MKPSRIDRYTLLNSFRRRASQHIADALWLSSGEANRVIRKTCEIPPNRAMGL